MRSEAELSLTCTWFDSEAPDCSRGGGQVLSTCPASPFLPSSVPLRNPTAPRNPVRNSYYRVALKYLHPLESALILPFKVWTICGSSGPVHAIFLVLGRRLVCSGHPVGYVLNEWMTSGLVQSSRRLLWEIMGCYRKAQTGCHAASMCCPCQPSFSNLGSPRRRSCYCHSAAWIIDELLAWGYPAGK